jgi:membrane-bound metal-dependent hydrolase YbcI (DUF457 family)
MGRSHILLSSASWLAVASAAPDLLGSSRLSPAELGCGAVLACGAAVAPDLDCPSSSISRCLGPVSQVASRHLVAKIALGHRQGTHSLLAVILVALGVIAAVHSSDARWFELGIAFLAASLIFHVLLDGRGVVCAALAAATAVTLVTIAPQPAFCAGAVIVGYLSHIAADLVTVEGVPHPLWPLVRTRRMRFLLIGCTDSWREHAIAAVFGVLSVWLLATTVFLPVWRQAPANANAAVRAPSRRPAVVHSSTAPASPRRTAELERLRAEVRRLRAQLRVAR